MSEPKSIEEYNARFHKAHKITGFGFDVTVHIPCPFCAAPDFAIFKVLETKTALANPKVCNTCKRGMKTVLHIDDGNTTQFEMVQTEGPDQPDWMNPRLRRV